MDFQTQLSQLSQRLDELNDKFSYHNHADYSSQRINLFDIFGNFETVSVVPTIIPSTPFEQIKVYVNGATLRLYLFDTVAQVWHYITLTA